MIPTAKSNYSLTVCMVNYNGELYLKESLGSIVAEKEKIDEIIMVDNASDDSSLDLVRERYPEVRVIELEENFGPGVARNIGFKAASNSLILFIDNDVDLERGCIDHLVEALMKNPEAAIAMPRVIYANNRNVIQYDGADCHFLGLMSLHNRNCTLDTVAEEIKKIGTIVTACFLIDRRKWNDVDPFDETFFFNLEDYDFGYRARLFGYDILGVPSALCYHKEGTKGLSLRPGGRYSRTRVLCLIRNRWQALLKNYALKTLIILSPILIIYEAFQIVGIIKKGWLIEWFHSLGFVIKNLRNILGKRKIIQKTRIVSDREILRNGPIPFSADLTKNRFEKMAVGVLNFLAVKYWGKLSKFI